MFPSRSAVRAVTTAHSAPVRRTNLEPMLPLRNPARFRCRFRPVSAWNQTKFTNISSTNCQAWASRKETDQAGRLDLFLRERERRCRVMCVLSSTLWRTRFCVTATFSSVRTRMGSGWCPPPKSSACGPSQSSRKARRLQTTEMVPAQWQE
jgi:hypothetical protein